jgi:TM2 domain-containing membrane protein YozV
MIMALVCFFLGGIGVHNFMMGEKRRGIKKIIFSFLCGIGGILALIDFVKILTDKYEVQLG